MTFQNSVDLCPAQRRAYDWFLQSIDIGNIFHLWADTGRGELPFWSSCTANLAALVTIQDFVEAIRDRHHLRLEDSLYQVLLDALQKHDHVIVDDLHLATVVMGGCGPYPRTGLIDAPMTVLAAYAAQTGKKLIVGTGGGLVEPLNEHAVSHLGSRVSRPTITAISARFFWAKAPPPSSISKKSIASPRT